ncbi:MAG TPA: glycosyltransferase family A protein [Bryobacteraceae bacterium]|nr:glycosyltransferase family A protein [Bryobacteraceae bacterium]
MALNISIVIPVYNAARYLEACLAAIRDLDPAPFECLVVDDGSTDDSRQMAGRAGVTVITSAQRRGPAAGRNLGARAARGDILLFVDADVVLPRDALSRIAARFSADPECDALIGSYDYDPASPDLISQYRNLLHCYVHQHGEVRTCAFWTGCGAIRNSVFRAFGGFDETRKRPSIEDVELGMLIRQGGGRVWLDKGLQVKHLKQLSFFGMLKTDLADRAIPWTRLILRLRRMPADLNLRWGQRFSVLASGWAAAALVLALISSATSGGPVAKPLILSAAVAMLAVVALNRDFYRFLVRLRGPLFAVRAFPLHWLHFLCAGAGFAIGFAAHACGSRRQPAAERLDTDEPVCAAAQPASGTRRI